MLSISRNVHGTAWKTPGKGLNYYEKDSYYLKTNTSGTWYGRGAKDLKLYGGIKEEDYKYVLYGYDKDGKKLLQNSGKEDRRAYLDLTFSAPKSVSLVALVDKKLETFHQKAVEKVLNEIQEKYIITRKGRGGSISERTDNLVIANFIHHESRENDPELHTHSLLMNMTKGDDGKYRSIEASEIFLNKMYLGMAYRNTYAELLQEHGYRLIITDREKGFFEIHGVDPELIKEYSKRSKQISETRKKNAELYDKYGVSEYEKKQMACIDSRKYKTENSIAESREVVASILKSHGDDFTKLKTNDIKRSYPSPYELMIEEYKKHRNVPYELFAEGFYNTLDTRQKDLHPSWQRTLSKECFLSKRECIEKACEDVTENNSTFREEQVILQAMKHGMCQYTAGELKEEFHKNKKVLPLGEDYLKIGKTKSPCINIYTTKEIQRIEKTIFEKCENGIGKCNFYVDKNDINKHLDRISKDGTNLSEGQKQLIKNICLSKDQYQVGQGNAGAGKTFAMNQAREILEKHGAEVCGFAPIGKAVKELESGARISSQTIDSFLEKQKHKMSQKKSKKPKVWIIDEASTLSSRKFLEFQAEAEKQNAKCVFIGDVKQFNPIEQGKMFFDLFDKSRIQKSELNKVLRQKSTYMKSVISSLNNNGDSKIVQNAFVILDDNKRIMTVEDSDKKQSAIVKEYLSDRKQGIDSYILCPRNKEKEEINNEIHKELVKLGEIKKNTTYTTFQSVNLNGIKKRISDNYEENQIVFFQNDASTIKKGTQAKIVGHDSDKNTLKLRYWDNDNKFYKVSEIELFKYGENFNAFYTVDQDFGIGDRIIFQKNDKRLKVSNGDIGTIRNIDKYGNATVILTSKDETGKYRKIRFNISNKGDMGYNYLSRAYCLTDVKSQGSSFDKTIINHSSEYQTNFNSMYVSITRAKNDVSIYTNNKDKMINQAIEEQTKTSTLDYTKPGQLPLPKEKGLVKSPSVD